MLGKSVVLFTRDKRGARPILTALRAAGNEAVVADDEGDALQLLAGKAVDLAVLDSADPDQVGRLVDGCEASRPIVVVARGASEAALRDIIGLHGVEHILGSADAREIATTVEKILRADTFGVDKYLAGFGVDKLTYEIECAEDRDEVVAAVRDYVVALGAGKEVAVAMSMVADELTTNAVYNAPCDERGESRYAARDRRDKIVLDPWEYARVDFGCDGRDFVIAVTDSFGSLSPSRIRSRLSRCLGQGGEIEHKAGGAGIGLYSVFTSVNQLVFNLAPGVCTQVIAVADITGRMRGIRERGQSFHLFIDGSTTADDREGIPESVMLSDSMRVAMRDEFASLHRAPAVVPLIDRKDDTVREPTPLDPMRGQLLERPPEVLGIDTMLGLLHGATTAELALEFGLRFVLNAYNGAVAFDVHGRTMLPWFACGDVADWQAAQGVAIDIADDCTIGRIAFDRDTETFTPTTSALDYQIAEITAGMATTPGLVLPVRLRGQLRYVIYAYGLRYRRPLARRVVARLQRELVEVLSRFSVPVAA